MGGRRGGGGGRGGYKDQGTYQRVVTIAFFLCNAHCACDSPILVNTSSKTRAWNETWKGDQGSAIQCQKAGSIAWGYQIVIGDWCSTGMPTPCTHVSCTRNSAPGLIRQQQSSSRANTFCECEPLQGNCLTCSASLTPVVTGGCKINGTFGKVQSPTGDREWKREGGGGGVPFVVMVPVSNLWEEY